MVLGPASCHPFGFCQTNIHYIKIARIDSGSIEHKKKPTDFYLFLRILNGYKY